jgi:hypothetical protein
MYRYNASENKVLTANISKPAEEIATSTPEPNWQSDKADISTSTYKYGDITFQSVGSSDIGAMLNVFQNGKLTQTKEGSLFYPLGSHCPWEASTSTISCDPDSSPAVNVDINGDGNKDFVFVDYNGGSGEYIGYDIFELPRGGTIKELMSFDPISGGATFKDIDNDGKLEVSFQDQVFNDWNGCGACTRGYGGTVIMSWDNTARTYVPNLSLMRQSPPTQDAIAERVRFYTKGSSPTSWCVTVQTEYGAGEECSLPWSYALKLIYTGNAAIASKYIDQVWPAIASYTDSGIVHFTSEQDFKNQFLANLKTSPYYGAILKLNGGKIF